MQDAAKLAYGRAYRKANPEKRRAWAKAWRVKNRTKINAWMRAWNRAHPGYASNYRRPTDQTRSYAKTYWCKRRLLDVSVILRERISARVRGALNGQRKSARTAELLGCSHEDLRSHLESQFQPGMTWENRREWHIDHIRPCASFDLTDPEQQKTCFHYTNLQPLWARDNLRKGSRVVITATPMRVPPDVREQDSSSIRREMTRLQTFTRQSFLDVEDIAHHEHVQTLSGCVQHD